MECGSEIVVAAGVPEFHVLVRPPCNALLRQKDFSFGAVANVIQLQSV